MPAHVIGLPVALVFFVAFVLVLPLVRHYRATGTLAVVVRGSSTSVETFVRWWTVGLLGAVAAWTVLVPVVGAGSLGAWSAPPALAWVGALLLATGIVLAVLAQAHMGTSWRIGIDDDPTTLVTGGVFRLVRHPIYTGILSLFGGIVCLTPAPWTVCAALLAYVLVAIQSRLEEEHMAGLHPAGYSAWAARTGRFIPGVGRWRTSRGDV